MIIMKKDSKGEEYMWQWDAAVLYSVVREGLSDGDIGAETERKAALWTSGAGSTEQREEPVQMP